MDIDKYFPDIGYTEEQPEDREMLPVHLYCVLFALVMVAIAGYYF